MVNTVQAKKYYNICKFVLYYKIYGIKRKRGEAYGSKNA